MNDYSFYKRTNKEKVTLAGSSRWVFGQRANETEHERGWDRGDLGPQLAKHLARSTQYALVSTKHAELSA